MTREEGALTMFVIEEWTPDGSTSRARNDLDMLAELLHATVHAGASVSFVLPFSLEEARAFWRDQVLPRVSNGARRVLVARCDGKILGTVQLNLAMVPNQQHRAEALKLLVHPEASRRGIARALMTALEELARSAGRTLLTLDTVTGGQAEPLYLSMGFRLVGVIPRYARAARSPELEAASFLYKEL
jgi:GNAT superfamily N-acetyltransferase